MTLLQIAPIIIISIAAIISAVTLIKYASKRSREMECPYCHREGKKTAPCSRRICIDCCKECYEMKESCKHMGYDLNNQDSLD